MSKELQDWKDSAMTVLDQWESVFETVPLEYRTSPRFLGKDKSEIVLSYIYYLENMIATQARRNSV